MSRFELKLALELFEKLRSAIINARAILAETFLRAFLLWDCLVIPRMPGGLDATRDGDRFICERPRGG